MPGSWEFSKPEVLVTVLTRELVATKWAMGFRQMQFPPSAGFSVLSGMPFDHARNTACENLLKSDFTWLFFLDDDVVTPPDAYARLAAHGKDIVSGLYYRRAAPIRPVMLHYVAGDPNPQWIEKWSPANSLIEVDLVGAGCLLIHRRVIERMSQPWFEWQLGKPDEKTVDGKPGESKLSEDFAFCRKAKRDFGFQIFVD